MNTLSAGELISVVALYAFFIGVAPYFTWRRGGSTRRIAFVFLVSLIPAGFIVGLPIAFSTHRSRPTTATAEPSPIAVGAATARAGSVRRLPIIGAAIAVMLTAIATGAIGYYLGQQNDPGTQPTWVDREIRATGTQNVGTLRCTYHLADGSVRVRESVITLSTNNPLNRFSTPNPFGARTPDCPPSP